MHSICRAAARFRAERTLHSQKNGGASPTLQDNPSNSPDRPGRVRSRRRQAGSGHDRPARPASIPEGFPLTYLWTLASKPAGSTARVKSPTSTVTQFTVDVPNSAYVVRLSRSPTA